MTISRRQFVGGVAGLASVAAPRLSFAQNSGPVRIGLLAAKTQEDRFTVTYLPKVGKVSAYALSRKAFGRVIITP